MPTVERLLESKIILSTCIVRLYFDRKGVLLCLTVGWTGICSCKNFSCGTVTVNLKSTAVHFVVGVLRAGSGSILLMSGDRL